MGTPVIPKFWRKRKQEIAEFQTNMVIYRESQASLDNIKRPCHKEKKKLLLYLAHFLVCVCHMNVYIHVRGCRGQREHQISSVIPGEPLIAILTLDKPATVSTVWLWTTEGCSIKHATWLLLNDISRYLWPFPNPPTPQDLWLWLGRGRGVIAAEDLE